MFEIFRSEPLYHYAMDRFSIISPILYRPDHHVVHIGGGPSRNHPSEINLNISLMANVDVVGNAECLPFADATIDVIISNAVLEHVRNIDATLAEINRVLKPGGFVYIEIPFMQHYHTHDVYGTRFEDYRRLTKAGLIEAFRFCTPLDAGVCVGPISAALQIGFSLLQGLSGGRAYQRVIEKLYYFIGNLFVWIDGRLSDATIQRSTVPSGVYFFGRKPDNYSPWLDRLPQPNSNFPRDAAANIVLRQPIGKQIELRIENSGRTTWLRASKLDWGSVKVGLQRTHGDVCERDFKRFELPRDIAPGESFDLSVDRSDLGAADAATIDLVIEELCWFEHQGGRPLKIALHGR